jgi:hypothetical protein
MEISLSNQRELCLYALALGFCSGVLYDLLKCLTLRIPGKISRSLLRLSADLLFCIACGGAFFALALGPGGGQLRFFLLLFVVPASLVYFLLLSKPVSRLLGKLLDFLGFILRCLLFPIKLGIAAEKKVHKNVKNLLRYEWKWYIIGRRYVGAFPIHKQSKEVHADENKTQPRQSGDNSLDLHSVRGVANPNPRADSARKRGSRQASG